MNWGIRVLQTHALPLGYGAKYEIGDENPARVGKIFKIGAEDEIRTRDVHLGKVTLYH